RGRGRARRVPGGGGGLAIPGRNLRGLGRGKIRVRRILMDTPTAALAWELWRRHRSRLLGLAGVLLGFALVYPKLCALAGFNPGSADALDELVRVAQMSHQEAPLLRLGQALYFLFLLGGPGAAMFLSLLCVTWMFTFIEFDPKAKNPMTFPDRIFTLPISTSFLFSRLLLGGLAAIVVLFY